MSKLMMVLLVGAAICTCQAGSQSQSPPFGPYRIDGTDGYGYVLAAWHNDLLWPVQLVKLDSGISDAEYQVVDTFTAYVPPRKCGDDLISYLTYHDSCVQLVTIGPLPGTERDTVMYSCFSPQPWMIRDFFFDSQSGLFTFDIYGHSDGSASISDCLIGRIGVNRQVDTVAYLPKTTFYRLLPDGTEISLVVFRDNPEEFLPGATVGLYDLVADSLVMPLDSVYNTKMGYRLSRDQPLYYIKWHPVHGSNVWRWSPEWGEELVTFFPKPDVVKAYELTVDSLICYVGMESDSASSGVTRVAVPIDAE